MKHKIKLYNVFFPIWMMWIFPSLWLIVLPANFLFDSFVLLIAMACLRTADKKLVYRKSILRIWLFGFLADLIGALLLFLAILLPDFVPLWAKPWADDMASAVANHPFTDVSGFLVTCVAVLLAGVLIYVLNRRFSFRKTQLPLVQQKKFSLILALSTAPYLFFLPTSLIYSQYN